MNRNTYERVREWFNQLDLYRRTLISRQFENYPTCDDLTQESGWSTFSRAIRIFILRSP